MESKNLISIKVCYAHANHQEIISLELPVNSSVRNAIVCSGVMDKYREIDLAKNKVGIFGNVVSLSHILSDNDRVEIYRSLLKDPMEARRLRAELNK